MISRFQFSKNRNRIGLIGEMEKSFGACGASHANRLHLPQPDDHVEMLILSLEGDSIALHAM
jgi:hypothetical protein